MRIPERFKLYGQTITVEWSDHLYRDTGHIGEARGKTNEIVLQSPNDTWQLTQEQYEDLCLHELVHMALDAMDENELSNNERFVKNFASLLHQGLTSGEGELLPERKEQDANV